MMADWAKMKAKEIDKKITEALREAERRGAQAILSTAQYNGCLTGDCPHLQQKDCDAVLAQELRNALITLAHNAERSRGGDSEVLSYDARGLEQSCKPHCWRKVAAGADGQERCFQCGSSRTPVKSVREKEKK